MKARPITAMAELVRTLEISPLPARQMKITPSTASRIGAILLAKNETMPSVLMVLGACVGPGLGAATCACTKEGCKAWIVEIMIMLALPYLVPRGRAATHEAPAPPPRRTATGQVSVAVVGIRPSSREYGRAYVALTYGTSSVRVRWACLITRNVAAVDERDVCAGSRVV